MRKVLVFIFFFLVEVIQFATASNLPPTLNCTVSRTEDGFFNYTLFPPPTITDHSSPNWANGTGHVFAHDHNVSTELVLNITRNSVTLKRCEEDILFKNDGAMYQEANCHVNCSLYAAVLPPPPPSDNHIVWLREHWWLLVLLVLALFLVVVWRKKKWCRCRDRRSKKGKEIYKCVKDGDLAGVSEVITEL